MSNEIDDLRSQLDQATKQLKSFNSSISRNTNSNSIFDNALKQSASATKEAADSEKNLSNAISGTISGLTGFTKSIANSGGSFAPLTAVVSLTAKLIGKTFGAIPYVGNAIKALGEGAGEVANHMIESFDKAYGTFQKLSDSGVVATFEDMKISARAMQLNYAQSESVLSKHSKNLALFAGSAVRGRQEFEKMAIDSYDVRKNFQKLGISGEEFSEMQLSYLNQQMRTGQGQKKTTEEMIAGSIEYIKELDAISKITGASKKDLQSEREVRMNDAKFRAGMASYPEKIQVEIGKFLDMLQATGRKDIKAGFQDYFASGGATGKVSQELLSGFAGQASSIVSIANNIMSGQSTYLKAEEDLNVVSEKSETAFRGLTAVHGTQLIQGKYAIEQSIGANRRGKDTAKEMEDYKKAQALIIANTTSVNSQLAGTKTSLEQATRDIEQMSTSGSLVTGLMKYMAEGIESVTEKMYEMSGEDLPAHLKARKEERKALEAEKKAREYLAASEKNVADNIISAEENILLGSPKLRLEKAIKSREEASAKRKAAEEAAGVSGSGSTRMSDTTSSSSLSSQSADQSDYAGLNIGGKTPGEAIAGGAASKNIIALARKMQARYLGGTFNAFNDSSHKNGKHKEGLAFDYSLQGYPKGEKIPKFLGEEISQFLKSSGAQHVIDEYNNGTPASTGGHIHAEVSARTGGIFSGPDSGYLAELHGDEAVAKVNDEKSISQSALGSGSMMTNSSNKISEIYTTLVEKMDSLIDLMDTSMENQKKFLEAKLN